MADVTRDSYNIATRSTTMKQQAALGLLKHLLQN